MPDKKALLNQMVKIWRNKSSFFAKPESAPKFRVYNRESSKYEYGPKKPTDVWSVLWSKSFNKMLLLKSGSLMLFENFLHGSAAVGCNVNTGVFKKSARKRKNF